MLTTTPYLRIRRPSPTAAEFTVSTLPPLTTTLRLCLYLVYVIRGILSSSILLFLYALWTQSPYGSVPDIGSTSTTTNPSLPLPLRSISITSSSTSASTGSAAAESTEAGYTPLITTTMTHLLHALLSSPPGVLATRVATHLSAPTTPTAARLAALTAGLAGLYLLTRRLHTEESVLVLRGLGVQTRSSSSSSPFSSPSSSSSLFSSSSSSSLSFFSSSITTRFIPTSKIRDVLINEAFFGLAVRHYLVIVVEGEQDVLVVFPRLLPRRQVVETVWRGVRECLYERTGLEDGKGEREREVE